MSLTQFFQPPLYWQQFEDLTESVVGVAFQTTSAQKIGRPGQAQDGVDVYAHTKDGHLGVQCKRLDDLDEFNNPCPGGPISPELLLAAVADAEAFSPVLDLFILATTAKRDARQQKFARELNAERHRRGAFGIRLWFWDDYITWLNHDDDLQRSYYRSVIQVRDPRDQDLLILELIGMAFDRPAFDDSLHHEHIDDFLQALSDTQAALRTGELVNRHSRHVIRKAIGGWREVSDPRWRADLAGVAAELRTLRGQIVEAVKDGRIVRRQGYLDSQDRRLLGQIDDRRRRCVDRVRMIMLDAGLPPP